MRGQVASLPACRPAGPPLMEAVAVALSRCVGRGLRRGAAGGGVERGGRQWRSFGVFLSPLDARCEDEPAEHDREAPRGAAATPSAPDTGRDAALHNGCVVVAVVAPPGHGGPGAASRYDPPGRPQFPSGCCKNTGRRGYLAGLQNQRPSRQWRGCMNRTGKRKSPLEKINQKYRNFISTPQIY